MRKLLLAALATSAAAEAAASCSAICMTNTNWSPGSRPRPAVQLNEHREQQ